MLKRKNYVAVDMIFSSIDQFYDLTTGQIYELSANQGHTMISDSERRLSAFGSYGDSSSPQGVWQNKYIK